MNGQSLQTGRIRSQDWSKIGVAVTKLSNAPNFIDDNPNATVMDIRARARAGSKKSAGDLGIVVVDYLQLMHRPGAIREPADRGGGDQPWAQDLGP